jgi:hypothetical protein
LKEEVERVGDRRSFRAAGFGGDEFDAKPTMSDTKIAASFRVSVTTLLPKQPPPSYSSLEQAMQAIIANEVRAASK